MIIVISGVSGAGKSEVGWKLAKDLEWNMIEGDTMHPAENQVFMEKKGPLDSEQRNLFTKNIEDTISGLAAKNAHSIVTYSCLTRNQRDRLRAIARSVVLVPLQKSFVTT